MIDDPVAEALAVYRSLPTIHRAPRGARLREGVRTAGRLSLTQVTRSFIRDSDARRVEIARLVNEGVVRIEVVPSNGRVRVDLVWVGE